MWNYHHQSIGHSKVGPLVLGGKSQYLSARPDVIDCYLLRFFFRHRWVSWRVVLDSARLILVLNDTLLHGLFVGTISETSIHWSPLSHLKCLLCFRDWKPNQINSLLVVLVSSGRRPLTVNAVVSESIIWIVICVVGLACISVGFVWNSCFRKHGNKLKITSASSCDVCQCWWRGYNTACLEMVLRMS